MKANLSRRQMITLLMACAMTPADLLLCTACNGGAASSGQGQNDGSQQDTSRYLVAIEEEPDTVDFQCTSIHYTIATNVFNRLVEMKTDEDGNVSIEPSLAESWEESPDGRTYTFHLREGVTFSNGSPLTAQDVAYTFHRLLTHPDSCNQDIAEIILGATRLESGETDKLEGFEILSDMDFAITLEEPFEAFLACLSMPGASILDKETTEEAGDRFGQEPAWTVGTGSYILREWTAGEGMILSANPNCFEGLPKNAGLDLRFMTEPEEIRMLFEQDGLDVLDLDEVGSAAEYFIHGDIYQERRFRVQRIATTYIALNESVAPLGDVRVRKALQLGLNRQLLLDAVYSGRGILVHGIYPRGLYGYNPTLPEIPFDPDQAKELLSQAGLPNGFDLTLSVNAISPVAEMSLARLIASMWEKIGVRVTVEVLPDEEFMRLRKSGSLSCYSATWTADYNDPDNFVYTFFGNRGNAAFRSLCYENEDAMARVRAARVIRDTEERLKEYQDLEQLIVGEDAAWIPLFSRLRDYVISKRVEGISAIWNGSVKTCYSRISIRSDR